MVGTCTYTCKTWFQPSVILIVRYLGILIGYCIGGVSLVVCIDDVLVPATDQLTVLPRTLRVRQTSPLAQVLLTTIFTMPSSYIITQVYTCRDYIINMHTRYMVKCTHKCIGCVQFTMFSPWEKVFMNRSFNSEDFHLWLVSIEAPFYF